MLRHLHTDQPPVSTPPQSPDWKSLDHADLTSRDRTKVKDAVKRYMREKVRNDWSFEWPPVDHGDDAEPRLEPDEGYHADDGSDDDDDDQPSEKPEENEKNSTTEAAEQSENRKDDKRSEDLKEQRQNPDKASIDDDSDAYSIISDVPAHFRALDEWESDVPYPDNEPSPIPPRPADDNYLTVYAGLTRDQKRALKRRELRRDIEWNQGLACFEARRIAWTQSRTVRLRVPAPLAPSTAKSEQKPPPPAQPSAAPAPSPMSPLRSSRRFFFRRSASPPSREPALAPAAAETEPKIAVATDGSSSSAADLASPTTGTTAATSHPSTAGDDNGYYSVETLVPLAPPILPPTNPLRASITPANYLQLYEKVIINSMQPSCPVNLADMVAACITGWKRDGEWPPRSAYLAPAGRHAALAAATLSPVPNMPLQPVKLNTARKARRTARSNAAAPPAAGEPAASSASNPGTRRRSITGLSGLLSPSRDRDRDVPDSPRSPKSVRQSLSKVFGLSSPVSPFAPHEGF